MKRLYQLLTLCAFILVGGAAAPSVIAAGANDAVCTACHNESWRVPVLAIYQTKHGVKGDARTPGCQSCHGESQGHLKQGPGTKPDVVFNDATDDRVRAGQCLNCHKGQARTNWDGGQHQNNQVACNNCHKVHSAVDKVRDKKTQTEVCFTCHKDQRLASKKISTHPIEVGKVVCSDCHNPHGSPGPNQLRKNTINETCFTCHAEKRGPYLWEHQPVAENCANCHAVHGSNIPPLLKSRSPFLCQECHDGPHNSKAPYGTLTGGFQASGSLVTPPTENAAGRGCANCHSMVHGSNHPAGALLHR